MNTVSISGNLGKDPEIRETSNGSHVCNFDIANKTWSRSAGEKTTWVRIRTLGKTAEACAKYLRKGSKVWVSGMLQVDTWEKDGQKKYLSYVLAPQVEWAKEAPQDAPAGDSGGGY